MGTRDLAELLDDAASGVPAPELAEAAWSLARTVRRRRTGVAAALAALAVLAVAGTAVAVTRPLGFTGPAPTDGGSAAPSVPPWVPPGYVDTVPGSMKTTPFRAVQGTYALPNGVAAPGASARRYSQHAPGPAVMLYQKHADERAERPGPVYALGLDGWTELDGLDLRFSTDGGNNSSPLRSTSLSPNRRLVAIPQPEELVVVGLGNGGGVTRIPVPGFNEHVLWRGNGTVLTGGDRSRYSVDLATSKVTPVAAGLSLWDLVADPSTVSGPVFELPPPDEGDTRDPDLALTEWTLDQPLMWSATLVDQSGLGRQHAMIGWSGRGWRGGPDGRYIVRAGSARSGSFVGSEAVAVMDGTRVVRMLDLGRGRRKACCEPLGWLDDNTVMLRTEKEGIVYWNIGTGDLRRVPAPLNAVLAVNAGP